MAAARITYGMALGDFYDKLNSLPQEFLCDATLVCTDGIFHANKLLLAVGSGYFLAELQKSCKTLNVPGVSSDIMRDVLDYLHKGTLSLVAGSERHKEFVAAAARLSLAGPFEAEHAQLMRSEAPTPPLPTAKGDDDNVYAENCSLEVGGQVSDLKYSEKASSESLMAEDPMFLTGEEEEEDEEEIQMEKTDSAPVRLLKEISGSLPILDQVAVVEEKISEVKGDMTEESGDPDDSGMADDEKVCVDDTMSTSTNWEVRYAPYLTPRRRLRARAKEVMGFAGKVWQCERCSFWAYYRHEIRRHQTSGLHLAI